MPKETNIVDVRFDDHGSIILVTPITPAAKDWIEENVQTEAWQWLGGGLSVEPRYATRLAAGMEDDGLVIA